MLNKIRLNVLVLGCSLAAAAAQTNSLQLPPIAAGPFKTAPADPAHNPLIWADVPDIAIMRVGKTYYMSSTTMHMSPGLPIMKSEDLVNWSMASYAYETLADNEALRLENGKDAYSKGSWAGSVRFHDGVFYATTFSYTSGRARGKRRVSSPRCMTTACFSTTTVAFTWFTGAAALRSSN
jgi:beta-xylosidase